MDIRELMAGNDFMGRINMLFASQPLSAYLHFARKDPWRDYWLCGVIFTIACFVQSAVADPIEEIVVTAQKRGEQNLQDAPSSITALTRKTLEQLGVRNFEDWARSVPSLTFTDGGPGDKQLIFRGTLSLEEVNL